MSVMPRGAFVTPGRITEIVVDGETWKVPRGFGAQYLRRAKDEASEWRKDSDSALITMLLLIGYEAAPDVIAGWSRRGRIEAFVYAMNVHLRASDNPIQAHPHLDWLPEPWRGPIKGQGVFCGPSPTVLA